MLQLCHHNGIFHFGLQSREHLKMPGSKNTYLHTELFTFSLKSLNPDSGEMVICQENHQRWNYCPIQRPKMKFTRPWTDIWKDLRQKFAFMSPSNDSNAMK